MDRAGSALTEQLRNLDLKTEAGVVRAVDVIRGLGISGAPSALPILLPLILARVSPVGGLERSVDADQNGALADAAQLAAHQIVRLLGTDELVSLDQRLREMSHWPAYPWDAGWSQISAQSVADAARGPCTATVLGLLSAHQSGYVREAAVTQLAMCGQNGLPWLLIRTTDWVEPVREPAAAAVRRLLVKRAVPGFIGALPLIRRLSRFTRVDQRSLFSEIAEFLGGQEDAVLVAALCHRDRLVRRATFELLVETGRLRPSHLERALLDRDVAVRLAAAHMVTADPSADMQSLREMLLDDTMGRIRGIGLRLMADANAEGVSVMLHAALDDGHRGVREIARHALSKRSSIDPAAHYRERVRTGPVSEGCLLGLGEVGQQTDWELLLPSLDGPPRIARAGLRSLARLNARDTRALRLKTVGDPRPGLSKDAAASLRTEVWESDEPILREYLVSPMAHVRRNAVGLVARLPGWRPPILLLDLLDEGLRQRADIELARWVSRRWIRGAPPSAEDAATLREKVAATTFIPEPTRTRLGQLLDFIAR